MWKNIWDKENSEKRPNKNFPLQKHFASTKNFRGQKQQLWNGVWTSNHTKVNFIYYSLWWSNFFPIFTRLAYQNDFLNLGVAILLLVAVALYFIRILCIYFYMILKHTTGWKLQWWRRRVKIKRKPIEWKKSKTAWCRQERGRGGGEEIRVIERKRPTGFRGSERKMSDCEDNLKINVNISANPKTGERERERKRERERERERKRC